MARSEADQQRDRAEAAEGEATGVLCERADTAEHQARQVEEERRMAACNTGLLRKAEEARRSQGRWVRTASGVARGIGREELG